MKKIISMAVILGITISCLALPVSAAKISPEIDDIISDVYVEDANGEETDVIIDRTDADDRFQPEEDDEKIIGYYDLTVKGDPKFPIKFKVRVAGGLTKQTEPYILVIDENGNIKRVPVEILKDGYISFVFDKAYKKFALVVKKVSTHVGTSDKTGDTAMPIAICFGLISLVAMGAAAKLIKKKEV